MQKFRLVSISVNIQKHTVSFDGVFYQNLIETVKKNSVYCQEEKFILALIT